MYHHFINSWISVLITVAVLWWLNGCTAPIPCHEPVGHWVDREGQTFIFKGSGEGLWLIQFGSKADTVLLRYRLNCDKHPALFDLMDIQSGPYSGKTLFGILEWNSDTSFRIRYEAGISPEIRPEAFDAQETLQFYKQ